jgi:hypothetical protein
MSDKFRVVFSDGEEDRVVEADECKARADWVDFLKYFTVTEKKKERRQLLIVSAFRADLIRSVEALEE